MYITIYFLTVQLSETVSKNMATLMRVRENISEIPTRNEMSFKLEFHCKLTPSRIRVKITLYFHFTIDHKKLNKLKKYNSRKLNSSKNVTIKKLNNRQNITVKN